MLAGRLDSLAQVNLLAVDRDAELLENRLSQHGGRDGAKELPLLADPGIDLDGLAIEGVLENVSVGGASKLTLLDVVTTLLELLELALGGLDCDALRKQVIHRVALGNVDDVTLATAALEFLEQNNFHVSSFLHVPLWRRTAYIYVRASFAAGLAKAMASDQAA